MGGPHLCGEVGQVENFNPILEQLDGEARARAASRSGALKTVGIQCPEPESTKPGLGKWKPEDLSMKNAERGQGLRSAVVRIAPEGMLRSRGL